MKNFFDNGLTSASVKKLYAYVKPRPSGVSRDQDDCWSEKTVRSLIRKLGKTKLVEELEKALSTQDPLTPCICIPRPADGRMQASQGKCLPHVVCCRVWRFPDVTSPHQLRSVPNCLYPFSKKLNCVCVNPFHYEKCEASGMCNEILRFCSVY
uniref:MH1 domain-containing protein n=1 Tax=Syphacia muris TaxID=451379 RepID=A0A0N5AUT0_9BILA